jgi:hypothetical protein
MKIPKGWHQHSNGGGLVEDTAKVETTAYVGPNARVYGNAQVFGNARVSGDAWEQSPLYIQGSRHALTNSRKGYIQIGCYERTFADWKKEGKAIAQKEGYTPDQIKEYKKLVDLFVAIGK